MAGQGDDGDLKSSAARRAGSNPAPSTRHPADSAAPEHVGPALGPAMLLLAPAGRPDRPPKVPLGPSGPSHPEGLPDRLPFPNRGAPGFSSGEYTGFLSHQRG